MPEMPCPFCGAHTTIDTIEGHIYRRHPEHRVHRLPELPLCPHTSLHPVLFQSPPSSLPDYATPMMVN